MDDNARKLERIKNSSVIHVAERINVEKANTDTDTRAVRARELFHTPPYNGIYNKYKEALNKHEESKK